MGWTIVIGGAVRQAKEIIVPRLTLPTAPVIPNDTWSQANFRLPSYGTWHAFAQAVGLVDFFYNQHNGLLVGDSGIKRLTAQHLTTIKTARAAYEQRYRSIKAVFNKREEQAHYARLVWLDFWIGFSLSQSYPAIYYS